MRFFAPVEQALLTATGTAWLMQINGKFELCSDNRGMESNDAISFLLQAHNVGAPSRWTIDGGLCWSNVFSTTGAGATTIFYW